jgi:hypothetical protein
VLQPWRHYVPLKKDHSNMKEVVDVLRDEVRMAEIISACYAEVANNPQNAYRSFMERFDVIIEDEMKSRQRSEDPDFDKADIYRALPFTFYDNPYGIEYLPPPYTPKGFKKRLGRLARRALNVVRS